MRKNPTRWLGAVALLSWIAPVCRAGVATVDYADTSGRPVVRVTFSDPRGEIGVEHLAAFTVGSPTTTGGGVGGWLTPTRAGAPLPDHDQADVRGGLDDEGRFLVDWSGVRVSIELLTPASCNLSLYGLKGTILKGQSAVLDMPLAMSAVAVMSSVKGNADLSISNLTGQTLCSSTLDLKHVPDECAFLVSDCGSTYSTMTIVGVARKSLLEMQIWVVNAY